MSKSHIRGNDSCQHLDHFIKIVEPLLSRGLTLLSWYQLLFLVVVLKDSGEPVPLGLQHTPGCPTWLAVSRHRLMQRHLGRSCGKERLGRFMSPERPRKGGSQRSGP